MLSDSFDRFYVVAKFELPKVEDLRFTTVEYDSRCSYLARNDTQRTVIFQNCQNIVCILCYTLSFTRNK